jgi:hypothetical protein
MEAVLWIRILDEDPVADPDPTFHPDADLDPYPDPSFKKAQTLKKVLK